MKIGDSRHILERDADGYWMLKRGVAVSRHRGGFMGEELESVSYEYGRTEISQSWQHPFELWKKTGHLFFKDMDPLGRIFIEQPKAGKLCEFRVKPRIGSSDVVVHRDPKPLYDALGFSLD